MSVTPSQPVVWGEYFDGLRALRQRAGLTAEDDYRGRVLRIELPDGQAVRWPIRDIRRLPDQAPGRAVAFGVSLDDPARIAVETPEAKAFLAGLGADLDRPLSAPPLWPRALMVAAAGGVALSALVFLILPAMAGLLAGFMNVRAEVAMGRDQYEFTRTMFGGPAGPLEECRDPDGLAALERLAARVTEGVDLPYELEVAVLDDRANPLLNAYAVAGGRITFFDSLIQLAETPEEVAAIFAHELGHVVHADPVRHTLQAASAQAVLAVLVGDLTGGGLLTGVAGQALTSTYSRGAETRADAFAHDRLTAAGLPPSALGRFFEKARDVWGETEGLGAHFSSHPQLTDRIEASARIGDPETGRPVLTAGEWAALRGICG